MATGRGGISTEGLSQVPNIARARPEDGAEAEEAKAKRARSIVHERAQAAAAAAEAEERWNMELERLGCNLDGSPNDSGMCA